MHEFLWGDEKRGFLIAGFLSLLITTASVFWAIGSGENFLYWGFLGFIGSLGLIGFLYSIFEQ